MQLIVEPVETGKRIIRIKNHKIAVPKEWKGSNFSSSDISLKIVDEFILISAR